ncbi:MAG: hypothetical protein PHS61_00020 [Candidatus Omnitrophica bacterium]|nr:hypothetical protein [Candidatus Omnitrophota bacterium]
MLKFPNKVKIKIIDELARSPIRIKNIIIFVHLFAVKKNDYYLGPFFSDINGEIEINRDMLAILAEAELQTGIMDYKSVNECSSLAEINILSREEIENLVKGRSLWGVIGREKELYGTKEELLNKINNNNNYLVLPCSLRVNWDNSVASVVSYDLLTSRRK